MQAQQSSRIKPKLPPKAPTLTIEDQPARDARTFRIKQLKSPKSKAAEPPKHQPLSKSINYNRPVALAGFNRYNAVDLMSAENLCDPEIMRDLHKLDDSLLVVPKYTRIPKESGTTAATSNQNYITFEDNC